MGEAFSQYVHNGLFRLATKSPSRGWFFGEPGQCYLIIWLNPNTLNICFHPLFQLLKKYLQTITFLPKSSFGFSLEVKFYCNRRNVFFLVRFLYSLLHYEIIFKVSSFKKYSNNSSSEVFNSLSLKCIHLSITVI